MQLTVPYVRSQVELLAEFKEKIRLGSSGRWTNAEFYHAINEALMVWSELVLVPHLYTLPNGWLGGVSEYSLPSHVRPPLTAQMKRPTWYDPWGVTATTSFEWIDVPVEIEPTGDGTLTMRPYAPPRTFDGRILYSAPNSRIPTVDPLPTLSGSITAASTSMVMVGDLDIEPVGYVRVGKEYMRYSGIERGASTTTLQNLVRAQNHTLAATASLGATVAFCVAADSLVLYEHLFQYAASVLHRMFQTDGSTHERATHQQMMLYHQQQADETLMRYKPERPKGKLVLGKRILSRR